MNGATRLYHLGVERERRGALEQVPLLPQQGEVAAGGCVGLGDQRRVVGRVFGDACGLRRPLRLDLGEAEELEPEQGCFLVLGALGDGERSAVVVTDVALAGLGRFEDALFERRHGHADVADDARARLVGGDPRSVLAVHEPLRGTAGSERRRDLVPRARRGLRRREVEQRQPPLEGGDRLGTVHRPAVVHRRGVVLLGVDAPVVETERRGDRLEELVERRGVARSGLHRRAPQLDPLLLAVGGEELGDVAVLLVRRRRRERVAVLLLERRLDLGVAEQIGAVEVDLDERLHRHAEDIPVGVGEVLEERVEVVPREPRRLQVSVLLEHRREVGQPLGGDVGVGDVLLDVDEVVDAGVVHHVVERLAAHLVPAGGLQLDGDAGQVLELGRQRLAGVHRRRRRLADPVDGRAGVRLGGGGPPLGIDRRGLGADGLGAGGFGAGGLGAGGLGAARFRGGGSRCDGRRQAHDGGRREYKGGR